MEVPLLVVQEREDGSFQSNSNTGSRHPGREILGPCPGRMIRDPYHGRLFGSPYRQKIPDFYYITY